jgi:hypothetical protein
MFLAGYGLLTIFQQRDRQVDSLAIHEVVATESSAVQLLFRVFQCPNVLQLIVLYV